MGQKVVQLRRPLAHKMGKYLAFFLAREIGARRGRGEIELGSIAGVLGHGGLRPDRVPLALPVSIPRSGLLVKQPGFRVSNARDAAPRRAGNYLSRSCPQAWRAAAASF